MPLKKDEVPQVILLFKSKPSCGLGVGLFSDLTLKQIYDIISPQLAHLSNTYFQGAILPLLLHIMWYPFLQRLDSGEAALGMFFDLTKAFDMVENTTLLEK